MDYLGSGPDCRGHKQETTTGLGAVTFCRLPAEAPGEDQGAAALSPALISQNLLFLHGGLRFQLISQTRMCSVILK